MPVARPSKHELLQAVEDFLRDQVVPELKGSVAYNARVAANVIAIVRRELAQEKTADSTDLQGLEELLETSGELEDLTRLFSERLREGALKYDDPRVVSHLKETAKNKVAIDNPKYPSFVRSRP